MKGGPGPLGKRIKVGKEVARFTRWERVDRVTRKRIVSLREGGLTIEQYRSEDGHVSQWKIQRKLDPKTAHAECRRKFCVEQGFTEQRRRA